MFSSKHLKSIAYIILISSSFTFCKPKIDGPPVPEIGEPTIQVKTIVDKHEIIWGMDFLPDADLLFTEKQGKIYRYHEGKITEITGVPAVNTSGQGGLLDLKVHPDYASNGWIYCTYSGTDNNSKGTLQLIRFKLNGNTLSNIEPLLSTSSPDSWFGHYGSRIVFDKAGFLYVSIGEGGPGSYGGASSSNMNAQNTKAEWGKVHRLAADGKIPADNPILPGNTVPTSVYSYGHRNPQGLVYNSITNEVWETEHGPKGGDELNIIQKGKNYGWPLVSNGVNYDGTTISVSPTMSGVEPPIHTWTPSIAPSGLAIITSDKYKSWKGNALAGSLAFTHLTRLEIVNSKVVKETKMLDGIGRVRNVKLGPDGLIYVSVEGPGRILVLMPE